jgi:hypothetical protein
MDWLEQELKNALARKEPNAGFDARVRRRIAGGGSRGVQRWLAAAAALLLFAGGGAMYRRHREEMAKEKVMLALRLAGSKLNQAQARVQEMGERQ